jgi:hypothetical protein
MSVSHFKAYFIQSSNKTAHCRKFCYMACSIYIFRSVALFRTLWYIHVMKQKGKQLMSVQCLSCIVESAVDM